MPSQRKVLPESSVHGGQAEELLDALFELARIIGLVGKAVDNTTILVHEPLAEVPWDVLNVDAHSTSLMNLRCLLSVNELWGL